MVGLQAVQKKSNGKSNNLAAFRNHAQMIYSKSDVFK
jgi:hypothetical protein